MNLLYYGDNLDVLRRHVDSESVDLVYLDPPLRGVNYYCLLTTTISAGEGSAKECGSHRGRVRPRSAFVRASV